MPRCGGERVGAASGTARPSPCIMALRAVKSPLGTRLLVVASPVTCRASGSGTPAPTIECRIRQKRSRTEVRMRSPTTGTLRSMWSRIDRAPDMIVVPRIATVMMAMATATTMYQSLVKKFATASSIRVGRGSLAFS